MLTWGHCNVPWNSNSTSWLYQWPPTSKVALLWQRNIGMFWVLCYVVVISWLPDNHNVIGLVQDCSISIANALEILQSCTKPSMWSICLYSAGLLCWCWSNHKICMKWFTTLCETVLSHAGLLNGPLSDTSKTMGSFSKKRSDPPQRTLSLAQLRGIIGLRRR